MLLKILGGLLVLTACGLAGFSLAGECSRRPGELRELQNMFEVFANEVRYLSNPLCAAFEKISAISGSCVAVFFRETVEILKKRTGINASEAWNSALKRHGKMTALAEEDLQVLRNFGEMLGKSDADGQLRSIELAIARLRIQERDAEERKAKSEGMYRKLGLLLGMAIIIILF